MPIRPLPLAVGLAALAGIIPTTLSAADLPCPRFATAPLIDGELADWAGRPPLEMSDATMVEDLKVEEAHLGWDEANLYFSLRMHDHTLVNSGSGTTLANGDCADLRLVLADGAVVRLCLAPISASGTPAMQLGRQGKDKAPYAELAGGTDQKTPSNGVRWAVRSDAQGWTVEAAIPAALITGKGPFKEGDAFPVIVIGWDRDSTTSDDWNPWHRRSESANSKKPDTWPRLVLGR